MKIILETKQQIVAIIESIPSVMWFSPLDWMVKTTRGASRAVIADGEKHIGWYSFFNSIGSCALTLLGSTFDLDAFCELLLFKHRRYGAASLEIWGRVGVLQRISAKTERLKNMVDNPDLDPGDECIVDTQQDILGYVVLGLRLGQEAVREET